MSTNAQPENEKWMGPAESFSIGSRAPMRRWKLRASALPMA